MWTRFTDYHSGGRSKERWDKIYIEAPMDEAQIIFYNRFGHNPNRVTCTCCGQDYGIESNESIEGLTQYDRNWTGKTISLEEYMKQIDVLFIPASKIKPEERIGDLPRQGYVWI